MSTEKKEDEGGCFSILIFLLVVGGLIYWGYTELKDADFVQKIVKSDKELIIGAWKVTGGSIYSDGETKNISIKKTGNNYLFGTIEEPAYYLFTTENELKMKNAFGKNMYYNYNISDNMIFGDIEMEIIELSARKLILKSEVKVELFPEYENTIGRLIYTFNLKKITDKEYHKEVERIDKNRKISNQIKKEKIIEKERITEKENKSNLNDELKTKNNKSYENYIYNGNYIYSTNITSLVRTLRSLPRINSEKIYEIPYNSKVYIINKNDNIYWKVHVNGYTGYISRKLLNN